MDFIYLHEIEQRNLLQLLSLGWGRGLGGETMDVTKVQYKSNQNCHYEFPLYNEYILVKNLFKKKKKP
jgi:hypothetical protein